MSMNAVAGFWQKVQNDPALQRRVRPAQTAGGSDPVAQFQKLAGVAREAGFDCTGEELQGAEEVTRFWLRVVEDERLQKELLPADELPPAKALQLIHQVANRAGFKCTLEQVDVITKAQVERQKAADATGELTDSDLDSVAGGVGTAFGASSFAALSGRWNVLCARVGGAFKYYW